MIWLIPNAAMAAGAARAWVARHRIAVAAATDALDDGFASGGEPVAEVEAAAAAAEDIEGEPPTAGCPGWCAEQAGHRVACRRLWAAAMELAPGWRWSSSSSPASRSPPPG